MAVFRGITTEEASRNPSRMKQMLDGMVHTLHSLQNQTGVTTNMVDNPAVPAKPYQAPPSSPQISVIGSDGEFIVQITPPQSVQAQSVTQFIAQSADNFNASNTPILYELSTATNNLFDLSGGVNTYPLSPNTRFDIRDYPNQSRYWRVRATFDGATFGDYVYAGTCGPSLIYSGLMRNSSTVINNAATTATGANPCTQNGVTTQVNVASSVWKCGDQTINYNSGSVDPGSFGTWLIYAKDAKRAGGTVTFFATANSSDITSDNANIYFGKITTSGGGGGTGSGGGGGTCCKAGVTYRRFSGTDQDCSTLKVGDDLLAVDGGKEIIQSIILHPSRPCFHLEFDTTTGKLKTKTYIGDFTVYQIELDRSHTFIVGSGGVIDGACSTHTIQYAGGGFTEVYGAVVDEVFNLIGGGCGSHNFSKL